MTIEDGRSESGSSAFTPGAGPVTPFPATPASKLLTLARDPRGRVEEEEERAPQHDARLSAIEGSYLGPSIVDYDEELALTADFKGGIDMCKRLSPLALEAGCGYDMGFLSDGTAGPRYVMKRDGLGVPDWNDGLPRGEVLDYALKDQVDKLRYVSEGRQFWTPRIETPVASPAQTPVPSEGEPFDREAVLSRDTDLADDELLEEHLRASSCTDEDGLWRPLWLTPHTELGTEGVGMLLYFELLRWIGGTFFLCALITTPLFVLCAQGSLVLSSPFGFAKLSIANIGTYPENWIGADDWAERDIWGVRLSSMTPLLGVLDACAGLFLLMLGLWLEYLHIPRLVVQHDEAHITPADYAIEVEGMPEKLDGPKHSCYDKVLKQHFAKLCRFVKSATNESIEVPPTPRARPPIVDLVLTRKSPLIKLNERKRQLTALEDGLDKRIKYHRRHAEVARLKSAVPKKKHTQRSAEVVERIVCMLHASCFSGLMQWRTSRWEKRLEDVKKVLADTETEIAFELRKPAEEQLISGAYVTFRNEEFKERVLDHFADDWLDAAQTTFEGSKLSVRQAPEPNAISFENLDGDPQGRKWRGYLAKLGFLVLLLLLVFFVANGCSTPAPIVQVPLTAAQVWLLAAEEGDLELCEVSLFSDVACTNELKAARAFASATKTTAYRAIDQDESCRRLSTWSSSSPKLATPPPPRKQPWPGLSTAASCAGDSCLAWWFVYGYHDGPTASAPGDAALFKHELPRIPGLAATPLYDSLVERSDVQHLLLQQCLPGYLPCDQYRCVLPSQVCDHHIDCEDAADERFCAQPPVVDGQVVRRAPWECPGKRACRAATSAVFVPRGIQLKIDQMGVVREIKSTRKDMNGRPVTMPGVIVDRTIVTRVHSHSLGTCAGRAALCRFQLNQDVTYFHHEWTGAEKAWYEASVDERLKGAERPHGEHPAQQPGGEFDRVVNGVKGKLRSTGTVQTPYWDPAAQKSRDVEEILVLWGDESELGEFLVPLADLQVPDRSEFLPDIEREPGNVVLEETTVDIQAAPVCLELYESCDLRSEYYFGASQAEPPPPCGQVVHDHLRSFGFCRTESFDPCECSALAGQLSDGQRRSPIDCMVQDQTSSCFNSAGQKRDAGGDSCAKYEESPHLCGTLDDRDFVAKDMCCACGGGSTSLAPRLHCPSCARGVSLRGHLERQCAELRRAEKLRPCPASILNLPACKAEAWCACAIALRARERPGNAESLSDDIRRMASTARAQSRQVSATFAGEQNTFQLRDLPTKVLRGDLVRYDGPLQCDESNEDLICQGVTYKVYTVDGPRVTLMQEHEWRHLRYSGQGDPDKDIMHKFTVIGSVSLHFVEQELHANLGRCGFGEPDELGRFGQSLLGYAEGRCEEQGGMKQHLEQVFAIRGTAHAADGCDELPSCFGLEDCLGKVDKNGTAMPGQSATCFGLPDDVFLDIGRGPFVKKRTTRIGFYASVYLRSVEWTAPFYDGPPIVLGYGDDGKGGVKYATRETMLAYREELEPVLQKTQVPWWIWMQRGISAAVKRLAALRGTNLDLPDWKSFQVVATRVAAFDDKTSLLQTLLAAYGTDGLRRAILALGMHGLIQHGSRAAEALAVITRGDDSGIQALSQRLGFSLGQLVDAFQTFDNGVSAFAHTPQPLLALAEQDATAAASVIARTLEDLGCAPALPGGEWFLEAKDAYLDGDELVASLRSGKGQWRHDQRISSSSGGSFDNFRTKDGKFVKDEFKRGIAWFLGGEWHPRDSRKILSDSGLNQTENSARPVLLDLHFTVDVPQGLADVMQDTLTALARETLQSSVDPTLGLESRLAFDELHPRRIVQDEACVGISSNKNSKKACKDLTAKLHTLCEGKPEAVCSHQHKVAHCAEHTDQDGSKTCIYQRGEGGVMDLFDEDAELRKEFETLPMPPDFAWLALTDTTRPSRGDDSVPGEQVEALRVTGATWVQRRSASRVESWDVGSALFTRYDEFEVNCGDPAEFVPCGIVARPVCIRPAQVCDGIPDCADGSDEQQDCDSICRAANEDGTPRSFECGDGACVPISWRCNGVRDCTDGSDEAECVRLERQVDALKRVGFVTTQPVLEPLRLDQPWIGVELHAAALVQCARLVVPERPATDMSVDAEVKPQRFQVFACDANDVRHTGIAGGLVLRNPWEQCAATAVEIQIGEPASRSWPIGFGVPYDRASRKGEGELGPKEQPCNFDMPNWVPFGRAQRALYRFRPDDVDLATHSMHPALRCFCFQRSVAHGTSELCTEFKNEQASRVNLVFGTVVLVATSLVCLQIVAFRAVKWVAPVSATDRDAAVFRLLLPTCYLLVVLGIVLGSACLPGIVGGRGGNSEDFDKSIADTDMDWYIHVGEVFILGLLFALFVPAVLFVLGLIRTQQRQLLAVLVSYTHREKLLWYQNMEFPLSARYTLMALVAGVAALCSGPQPSAWWLGAAYMAVSYWCDKWLLLRASRRAPHTDAVVSLCVARFLVVYTLLKSLGSCWTLSYQPLFPSEDGSHGVAAQTAKAVLAGDFAMYPLAERLAGFSSKAALPNFAVFLFALGVLVVQKFLDIGMSSPAAAGILSAIVPGYMRILRRIKAISTEGETTQEDWDDAIPIMQKYATITSYDYSRQRRYGGNPGAKYSDSSTEDGDKSSVSASEATEATEYDALGGIGVRQVKPPPPPPKQLPERLRLPGDLQRHIDPLPSPRPGERPLQLPHGHADALVEGRRAIVLQAELSRMRIVVH